MENAKTRIIIEQANGLKKEFECEGYAATLFDCVAVTEDGKSQEVEATVVADHVSQAQVAAIMMCDDNPFSKAHEFLKGMKVKKMPWSLRRKLKKMVKEAAQ